MVFCSYILWLWIYVYFSFVFEFTRYPVLDVAKFKNPVFSLMYSHQKNKACIRYCENFLEGWMFHLPKEDIPDCIEGCMHRFGFSGKQASCG